MVCSPSSFGSMLNLCQNLFDYGDNAKDTSLLEVKKFDFACSNFHSFISHCFGHLTSVDPHFLPGPKLFGFWSKVLSFKRKNSLLLQEAIESGYLNFHHFIFLLAQRSAFISNIFC